FTSCIYFVFFVYGALSVMSYFYFHFLHDALPIYFYTGIFLSAYLAWVIGSLAGGVLGEVIPPMLSDSMGIALYALFISLLVPSRSEEHTSELQSRFDLVCRLLLAIKK